MKEKIKKYKWGLLILVIILIIILFKIISGIVETKQRFISYKIYTEKAGWSSWKQNGEKSNNIYDENIKKIKFKLSKFNKESLSYSIFTENGSKWSDQYRYNESIKKQNITGIRISPTSGMIKNYDICYRTYNKKNGWLEWACNDEISGNKTEKIYAIQVKIIPKNVIKNEYLQDYNKNKNDNSFINF